MLWRIRSIRQKQAMPRAALVEATAMPMMNARIAAAETLTEITVIHVTTISDKINTP